MREAIRVALTEEVLAFLDDRYDGGALEEAGSWVQVAKHFGLEPAEARRLCGVWRATYDLRHPASGEM